jgi:hypothetical protein
VTAGFAGEEAELLIFSPRLGEPPLDTRDYFWP